MPYIKIEWPTDQTKRMYKYLSMQTHTMPMSFHRTEINRVYTKEGKSTKALAGFAIEHARQALCVWMPENFPDVEEKLDSAALIEWTIRRRMR
jgi:hypothetical protein